VYLPLPCSPPLPVDQVLGEYAHLKEGLEPVAVLRLLASLLDLRHSSSDTKSWALTAMAKLCDGPACASVARELAERHGGSLDTVLRQRLHELQHLAAHGELRARVLPRTAGLEPLEVVAHHLRDPKYIYIYIYIYIDIYTVYSVYRAVDA